MIGVIGAGAFGTALATVLHRAGQSVMLWGRNPTVLAQIRDRQRTPYFGDQKLPKGLMVSTDLAQLAPCSILILAIPTQKLRGFLQNNPLPIALQSRIIVCAKGLEQSSGLRPSQVVQAFYDAAIIQILSGPAFAADLVAGLPTAMSLAGDDDASLRSSQHCLSGPALRLYRSHDPLGVQLCGALKNVYAIGCGALMGAGLGDSARAALITRAFRELRKICTIQGGQPQTVHGLAGMGDLLLTCNSEQSRNYRYGYALGAQSLWDSNVTVEGVPTARAMLALHDNAQDDLPIAQQILALIDGRSTVDNAMQALMQRDLRVETE